jgi:hypothetical protein
MKNEEQAIAQGRVEELNSELDEATALIAKQATILTGVANALHGGESPLVMWSHHDLAELAAAMVSELESRRNTRVVSDALFAAANADVDRIAQRVVRLEAAEASRAGRTTPPTDAEVAAHSARGGSWRCIVTINGEIERNLCSDLNSTPPSSALVGFPRRRGSVYVETWWALDDRGWVCAWPIVEVRS